jgi:hypothetical protein
MDPKDSGKYLRSVATHHVHSHEKWGWTRKHDIKRIVTTDTGKGQENLGNRIKHTVRSFRGLWFPKDSLDTMFRDMRADDKSKPLWDRIRHQYYIIAATLRVGMRTDKNIPDGMFPTGVYAVWEEDGEYIQVVQPSVGVLVADFLEAEPENPHAIKIAEEIAAILDNYSRRVKAGEVDGRKRVAESSDSE